MAHIPEYLTTHVVSGDRMVYALDNEAENLAKLAEGAGRRGLTLAKEAGVSVVMVGMDKGNLVGTHSVAGSVTIQVLSGRVEVRLPKETVDLLQHQIAILGSDVEHSIMAHEVSVLLLTVCSA